MNKVISRRVLSLHPQLWISPAIAFLSLMVTLQSRGRRVRHRLRWRVLQALRGSGLCGARDGTEQECGQVGESCSGRNML